MLCLNSACVKIVFLPEASFGLRVLSLPVSVSVCVCVRPCINPELVRAIIHHPFKLGPKTFRPEVQNTLVKIPIVLVIDSAWHVKFNLFSKSCLFASLLRLWNICETCKNMWKRSLFHILNGCAQICSPTASCHGPWNNRVVSLVLPLLASQSLTRRLAMDFLMLLYAFATLYIPHMPKLCMPIFGNGWNK